MKVYLKSAVAIMILTLCTSCDNAPTAESTSESQEKSFVKTSKEPTFYRSHEPKKQAAAFSDIVQVGDTYYLAGQIGMNHKTRTLVDETIEGQTKQTLENIKEVLAQHDLKMKDVVKATVILDHIEDFQAFNKIYEQYFPQKPARTTFAAEALAAGALIEIEVVAVSQK
ncbi:MAG: RidA family protein [Gilvibacter sp.]